MTKIKNLITRLLGEMNEAHEVTTVKKYYNIFLSKNSNLICIIIIINAAHHTFDLIIVNNY